MYALVVGKSTLPIVICKVVWFVLRSFPSLEILRWWSKTILPEKLYRSVALSNLARGTYYGNPALVVVNVFSDVHILDCSIYTGSATFYMSIKFRYLCFITWTPSCRGTFEPD